MSDTIIDGMAVELRAALIGAGLDPKNPPVESNPPTAALFAEYQKRGGGMTVPEHVAELLIQRAGELRL